MPDPAANMPALLQRGRSLTSRLSEIALSLTEAEYRAAAILDFDPEAALPDGALATPGDAAIERDPAYQLHGTNLDLATWQRLACASLPEAANLDRASCLALFLARRVVAAPGDDQGHRLSVGDRVRIRPRQRIGGDRYANRKGVIVKPHFAGFYVELDRTAREKKQKTELVAHTYLEKLDTDCADPPAI